MLDEQIMEVASGTLSPILEHLINSVLNIARQVDDFENQLKDMKMRVAHVKVLLEANRNSQANYSNNEAIKQAIHIALSEFRNLMYEAEDVLTDCHIRKEYHTHGRFSNFLPPNFLFRLQTQKKMEVINRRIQTTNDILGGYLRVAENSDESDDSDESESDDSESDNSDESESDKSDQVFGIEDDVNMIREWIFSPGYGNLRKLGVVGMGGLGETTVAKVIFNDAAIRSYFDKKIWVSVSKTFRKEEIVESIAEQLGVKSDPQQPEEASGKLGEKSQTSGKKKLSQILSLLKDSSYLLILDDIWHQEKHLEWWERKFFSRLLKSTGKQSCIIITTRDIEVASDLIKVDKIHSPRVLDEEDGWLLFSKHAFSSAKKEGLGEFEELGKQIVRKCRGLPLAIKTIGGLLGSADSIKEWNDAFEKFREPTINKENDVVMNSLNLSYEALPVHLKRCLLCFSIYPEDYVICGERLIHWWIGEGLVHGRGRKTAVELGFEYLSKLVSRCLVEVVDRQGYDGRVYSCRMHDLVRDLIIMMANKENLRRADDQDQQASIQEARWFCCTTQKQANSVNQSPKLRALLMLSMDKTKLDKNLRSLTSLRALDLSNNKLDKDSLKNLFSWISVLKRLAYLNLSESKCLKEVPDSICKLKNLQFLILTECCNLSKLSPSVIYLKRLVVLNLGACDSLPYLPRGLGRLAQLQELYGLKLVRRGNRRSCPLVELQELSNLRVLHIKLSKDSDVTEQECKVLSEHEKLKVMSFDFDTRGWEGTGMHEMLNKISPPPKLEELYLRRYYHQSLPAWMTPESLPNLLHLSIEDGRIAEICTTTGNWSLQRLYLNILPYLRADWEDLKKKMPSLRYAEISGCTNVQNLPGEANSYIRSWRRNQYPIYRSQQTNVDSTEGALVLTV